MARRVLPQGDPTLPPPGDARREALRERDDDLAEAAETAGADRGTIDPRAFEPDREILQHWEATAVPNARPESRYCWVQCGAQWYGRFVNAKRAEGWEIVRPSDDDAPSDVGQADGTCRVGDTLLMRIRADRYIMLARRREARQRAIETGITSELEELGDKYSRLGVNVRTNDTNRVKQMATRAAARDIASRQMNTYIREGRVPGMPAPGQREG